MTLTQNGMKHPFDKVDHPEDCLIRQWFPWGERPYHLFSRIKYPVGQMLRAQAGWNTLV